jgi:8-oxo-dGTP diphosphatase
VADASPRQTVRVVHLILGASAVIVADGAILLVQRGHEPQLGRWSVPGGRVEPGETLAEAAQREAYEETGLEVRIGEELWSLTIPDGDRTFEVHDFAATVTGGSLRAGDDAADVRWIPFDELDQWPLTDGLIGYLTRGGVIPPA